MAHPKTILDCESHGRRVDRDASAAECRSHGHGNGPSVTQAATAAGS